MPASNLDLAREALDAFSRGDFQGCISMMDPKVEWHLVFPLPDLPPEKTVFRGRDEVWDLFRVFRDVWDELTIELEEAVHDEGDLLIIRVRFRGQGHGSGVQVDRVVFLLQELRDEKLLRQLPFESEAEARRAAGLDDG
ncbi:MAG: nuclear transport factor 2 family protein [Solirubrobacterales bacterium]